MTCYVYTYKNVSNPVQRKCHVLIYRKYDRCQTGIDHLGSTHELMNCTVFFIFFCLCHNNIAH